MNKFLFTYFLFCLFFFSFFASGFLDSQDGLQYLTIARRIYYDHTFEMPNETYDDNFKNIHMNVFISDDGKRYPATGLGYSLALIPSVMVESLILDSQNLKPITAFPLENDWPVLFLASMTNSFFGALLALFMTKMLCLYKFKEKTAAFLTFIFIISTNLFTYTKHSFAHMMFTSFLVMTFYYLKLFFLKKERKFLVFSVISFSIMMISYNSSYIFTLPAIGLFYIFHRISKRKIYSLLNIFQDMIISIVTITPFYLLNKWYLSFREVNETGSHIKANYFQWLKPYVLLEGLWGLLFSPGKSIVLFSPILIILILFWFKFDFKKYWKELFSFLSLFLTYLLIIATSMGSETFLLWHGDSSYGNRYLVPVIPFLLILVAFIYKKMTKTSKKYVFFPLIFIGILIQIPGILLPYQIRFAGLESNVYFNDTRFSVSEYGNLIPRYSPVFKLSKTLIKRVKNISSLGHGNYNLKFRDGFDYPFDLGWTTWRMLYPKSQISYDSSNIKKVSLKIKNHQIEKTSSYSAQLVINEEFFVIDPEEEKIIELYEIDDDILNIDTSFIATSSALLPNKQVVFLESFWINDILQNINTIDYPYVSPISKSLLNIDYYYWGNIENDPWSLWHMHSGVYEQTFDIWWIRPFHYWDLPKNLFLVLFIINLSGVLTLGYKILKYKK